MPDLPYSNRADLGNVLQHLEVEKAALIGCSMGGATAIAIPAVAASDALNAMLDR